MSQALYTELLKRPIAYHPVFRKITGSTAAAVMLSQMYYWSSEGRINEERNGWFHKTIAEWEMETGLSRSEQDRARRDLVKAGMLEEVRKGSPARMWYRLNIESLIAAISQFAESCKLNKSNSLQDSAIKPAPEKNNNENNSLQNSENQFAESCNQECEILQSSLQDSANSHTEITTEITSESDDDGAHEADVAVDGDYVPADQLDEHEARIFSEFPIRDITPHSSPLSDRRKFEMHWTWLPGPSWEAECRLAGLNLKAMDIEQQELLLVEFRDFWIAKGVPMTQREWERVFRKRLATSVPGTTSPAYPGAVAENRADKRARMSAEIMSGEVDW